MKAGKALTMAGVLLASAVLLVACKAEEQGRVLLYKKGVYLGKADKPLTEEQLGKLRARTALQGAGNTAVPGGGLQTSEPDVRPPAASGG